MKDFKLDNEPKIGNGFKIPDGYLDDFQERMLQNLPIQEPKVIPLYTKTRNWMMSAAAVLIVALTVPIYNNFNAGSEELDAASIENYLTYQTNISQYDLINLLDNEDLTDMNIDLALEDTTIEDILTNSNNLENYIYEN